MDDQIKENLTATSTWGRGLFMILFAFIYTIAEIVLGAVVLIQFVIVLVSGSANERLLELGKEISQFIYQVFLFLTFNTETKPFPFDSWPSEKQSLPGDEGKSTNVSKEVE